MKPIFWTLVTLVIATTSVSAQEYESDTWLGGISAQWLLIDSDTTFSIHVHDSVQDGCWTNIESVKNAVTLELTRSGYTIDDASYADFRIWISGLGGTTSSTGCAVSYDLQVMSLTNSVFTADKHRVTTLIDIYLWEKGGMRISPKTQINRALKESYVDLIQAFLLEIPRQQKQLLRNIVELERATPEARAYWSNFKVK